MCIRFPSDGLPRSAETQSYIDHYYEPFERLQQDGLDALVITGANVANPSLEMEPFWQPLQEVIAWATESTTSVLCSCLATHALMKQLYGINRQPLPRKKWGVYSHRVTQYRHPLLAQCQHALRRPPLPLQCHYPGPVGGGRSHHSGRR